MSEAAYAKDIHSRRYPGAYAAIVNDLPVFSIRRRARAASDVLGYARAKGDWKTEEQAYHVLYPQICAASVGTAAPFVPVVGRFISWGGAAAGHVTGRTVARVQRSKRHKPAAVGDPPGGSDAVAGRPPLDLPRRRSSDAVHASHEQFQLARPES